MERGPAPQAMNGPTPVGSGPDAFSAAGNYSRRSASLWILFLSLALLPLQISNQSLWIDEGDTASYALQPDLHAWVQRLVHDPIPDCQMPLTMWTAWLGAHSLGSAEWQLRVINLLWAAGALLAMFYAGKCLGSK